MKGKMKNHSILLASKVTMRSIISDPFSFSAAKVPISIAEFMALEDKDLKKYLFAEGMVRMPFEERVMIDDDDKKAWYIFEKALRVNNQGTFYKNSKIREYIVYDKKTKKVRISAGCKEIFQAFLNYHFTETELFQKFILRATKTLCKKIVEGKINTLMDLMAYHRSYTVKNKSLSLETIFKFASCKSLSMLHVVEDPENLETSDQLKGIPWQIPNVKPFKFKIEEIPELNNKLNEWNNKQGEVYDTFLRLRASEDGNIPLQESELQTSSFPPEVFGD